MNTLLLFFALPIATIIISIALQKILKCPLLVAAIIFAVFLIVTFVIDDLNFLIATIVYTIISFITAFLTWLICRLIRRFSCNDSRWRCGTNQDRDCSSQDNDPNNLLTISSQCGDSESGNLLTIYSNGCNGANNDLLTINSNNISSDDSQCNCGCRIY